MTIKRNLLLSLSILILAGTACLLSGCSSKAPAPAAPEQTEEASTPAASEQTTEASAPSQISMGTFTTEDLEGNEITEQILSKKEYTMVNVWGTFCGPCINEMPALEELHQSLPENIQMIGVVCDLPYGVSEDEILDQAKEIVTATGVTYPSLRVWENADWFYSTSNVVPTTYFFNSEGNLVGDIIYGADLEAYQKAIESLGK